MTVDNENRSAEFVFGESLPFEMARPSWAVMAPARGGGTFEAGAFAGIGRAFQEAGAAAQRAAVALAQLKPANGPTGDDHE